MARIRKYTSEHYYIAPTKKNTDQRIHKYSSSDATNNGGLAGGAGYLFSNLVAGGWGLFENTGRYFQGKFYDVTGNHKMAEYTFAKESFSEKMAREATEEYKPGGGMQFFGSVSQGLGQSLVQMGISAIPAVGKGLSLGLTGSSSNAAAISNYVRTTGELDSVKAYGYGFTISGIEVGLEALLGVGMKAGGGKLGTTFIGKLSGKTGTKSVGKAVAGVAKDAFEEGLEEAIAEIADPLLQRAWGMNPDATIDWGQVLYAGAVGAAAGGILSGAGTAIQTGTAYSRGKSIVANGTADVWTGAAQSAIGRYDSQHYNTKTGNETLISLKKELNAYNANPNKTGTNAMIQLGNIKRYTTALQVSNIVAEASRGFQKMDIKDAEVYASFLSGLVSGVKVNGAELLANKQLGNGMGAADLLAICWFGGAMRGDFERFQAELEAEARNAQGESLGINTAAGTETATETAPTTEIAGENTVQDGANSVQGVDGDGKKRYNSNSVNVSNQEYAIVSSSIMEKNAPFIARNESLERYGSTRSANFFYVYENFAPGEFKILKQIPLNEQNRSYISLVEAKIGENNGKSTIRSADELNRVLKVLRSQSRSNHRNNAHGSNGRADSTNGGIYAVQPQSNARGTSSEGNGDLQQLTKSRNSMEGAENAQEATEATEDGETVTEESAENARKEMSKRRRARKRATEEAEDSANVEEDSDTETEENATDDGESNNADETTEDTTEATTEDTSEDPAETEKGKREAGWYTAEVQDKARSMVRGFDMMHPDTRARILEMIASGKNVDKKTLAALANVMAANFTLHVKFRNDMPTGGFRYRSDNGATMILLSTKATAEVLDHVVLEEVWHGVQGTKLAKDAETLLKRIAGEDAVAAEAKKYRDEFVKHFGEDAANKQLTEGALMDEAYANLFAKYGKEAQFLSRFARIAKGRFARVFGRIADLARTQKAKSELSYRQLMKLYRAYRKAVFSAGIDNIAAIRAVMQRMGDDEEENKGANSMASIGYSFFGRDGVTLEEFESGAYKSTAGYKKYVAECVENMRQTRSNFSESDARAEIESSIEGIVNVAIAAKRAGYDIADSGEQRNARDSKNRLLSTSLEPNSDYFTSNDISTECDKRKNFAEIYDAITAKEEAMGVPEGKRFFKNVDNYFYIHKVLADKGLTTPCRQCYVESMRKNLTPMALAFLTLVKEEDAGNKANAQLYAKGELKKNNAKIREGVRELLTEYGIDPQSLTVKQFTTAKELARMRIERPLLYEAFNSFYGQSKPKMPRKATPFRFGELTALLTDDHGKIKEGIVKQINRSGGFRLQSYSDFQIENFVDVLQVIFEAGTLGLSGHAYTKVPAFLKATEGTNLKRNISVFMYNDGGEWIVDQNDSFPGTLDQIYSLVKADDEGNTGIIAVSQNDDMSAFLMVNDQIAYVIPFHKSGIKMGTVRDTDVKTEDGRTVKGYAEIKDHTRQQSEVWAKTTAEHKAGTKVGKPINIYDELWDFENEGGLSKKALIEKNVKAYIDACEEAGYLPKFRAYVMDNAAFLKRVLAHAKKLGAVSQDATVEDISFKHNGYTIPYGYEKFLGDYNMFTPDGKAAPAEVLSLKGYDFDAAVDFFSDAEKLRRNEILQQFANGKERAFFRESGLTADQLMQIVEQRRADVVDEIVGTGGLRKLLSNRGANSMVGIKARTADASLLERAKEMESQAADSESIRAETGWFKSYDGMWRFEIDDSTAVWHLDSAKPNTKRLYEFGEKIYKLSDLIDHPALFEAYPELKEATVWENPNAKTSGYVVGRSTDAITVRSLANTEINKDILIHEIQHLIQHIEGFVGGASIDQFSYKAWGAAEYQAYEKRNEIAKKLYAILRRHGISITKQDIDAVRTAFEVRDSIIDYNFMRIESLADRNKRTRELLDDYYDQVQILNLTTPDGQYHAVAGEIEAYDVQARRRMTSEQRKELRPNVDRADVIVDNSVTSEYNIYTATRAFLADVHFGDRESFSLSLSKQTSGMKNGERRICSMKGNDRVYYFMATGYMQGYMITKKDVVADAGIHMEDQYARINGSTRGLALWIKYKQLRKAKSNRPHVPAGGRGATATDGLLSNGSSASKRGGHNDGGSSDIRIYTNEEVEDLIQKLKQVYDIRFSMQGTEPVTRMNDENMQDTESVTEYTVPAEELTPTRRPLAKWTKLLLLDTVREIDPNVEKILRKHRLAVVRSMVLKKLDSGLYEVDADAVSKVTNETAIAATNELNEKKKAKPRDYRANVSIITFSERDGGVAAKEIKVGNANVHEESGKYTVVGQRGKEYGTFDITDPAIKVEEIREKNVKEIRKTNQALKEENILLKADKNREKLYTKAMLNVLAEKARKKHNLKKTVTENDIAQIFEKVNTADEEALSTTAEDVALMLIGAESKGEVKEDLVDRVAEMVEHEMTEYGKRTTKSKTTELAKLVRSTIAKARDTVEESSRYYREQAYILRRAKQLRDNFGHYTKSSMRYWSDPSLRAVWSKVGSIAHGRYYFKSYAVQYAQAFLAFLNKDGVQSTIDPMVYATLKESLRTIINAAEHNYDVLKALSSSLEMMEMLLKTYQQNAYRGRFIALDEQVQDSIGNLKTAQGIYITKRKSGSGNEVYASTAVGKALRTLYPTITPQALCNMIEGFSGGYLSGYMQDIIASADRAKALLNQWMEPIDKFIAENKSFAKKLQSDSVKFDWNGKTYYIPLSSAIYLHMLTKREQALPALASAKIDFYDINGEKVEIAAPTAMVEKAKKQTPEDTDKISDPAATPEEEMMLTSEDTAKLKRRVQDKFKQISDQFDTDTFEFIKKLEHFYNKVAKAAKEETDLKYLGFSNVLEDYYVPLLRAEIQSSTLDSMAAHIASEIQTMYSFSFNKNTINSKASIQLTNIYDLTKRHARGLSMYHEMYGTLTSFDRWYNHKLGDAANPQSVKNEISKIVPNFDAYLRKLLSDVQGIRLTPEALDGFSSFIRGALSTSALGANLATPLKQHAGYLTALPYISMKNLLRGGAYKALKTNMVIVDKQDLDEMMKHSPAAAIRYYKYEDSTRVRAEANLEKLGRIASKTTILIDRADMAMVMHLWSACKYQIQDDTGHGIDTEENHKLAGELLNKVINETQGTYSAATRTGLQRSRNEFAKAITMFSSDSAKQLTMIAESVFRVVYYRRANAEARKNGTEAPYSAEQIRKAIKDSARASSAVVISQIAFVLIGMFVNYGLFNKDYGEDEEENKAIALAKTFGKEFGLAMAGIVPVLDDILSFFLDGYEVSSPTFDAVNDVLNAFGGIFNVVSKGCNGEVVRDYEWRRAIRDVVYSVSGFVGIPTRNVYNTFAGIWRRFSEYGKTAEKAFWYGTSSEDLNKAVASEDEEYAAKVVGLIAKNEQTGEMHKDVANELARLYVGQYVSSGQYRSVVRNVGNTYADAEGNVTDFTAKERKKVQELYAKADDAVSALIATEQYAALDDDQKADAISKIYDAYYRMAVAETVEGKAPDRRVCAYALVENESIFFAALAYAADLKADAKYTKKQKLMQYLSAQDLSRYEKSVILWASGYDSEEVSSYIKSYLRKNGSEEDIAFAKQIGAISA